MSGMKTHVDFVYNINLIKYNNNDKQNFRLVI